VPGPERGDRPERTPADLTEEERARATRALVTRLQVGGIVFLAAVLLGLLPAALSAVSPSLGRSASGAAWVIVPLLAVALLAFAALRLRR
jgi:hypothetical protein